MPEASPLIAFVKGLTRTNRSMRTGATALITVNLQSIHRLRDEGHTWDEIAAGLATLGARQKERDGGRYRPISGKRVAALIAAMEKREARRALRQAKRKRRPDLVVQNHIRQPAVIAPKDDTRIEIAAIEDKLRQEAFEVVQSMMRKTK